MILYIFFRKRINDKLLRVIVLLIFIGFAVDMISIFLTNNHKNTAVLTNLFTLTETLFISFFFFKIYYAKSFTRLTFIVATAFSLFWIFMFLKYGITGYLEICVTIESVIILCFSVCYLYEQVVKSYSFMVYFQPRFWVVVGFLFYAAGTFFLFLLLYSLNKDVQKEYYNLINSMALIIKSVSLSIAMLMRYERPAGKKAENYDLPSRIIL